VTAARPEKFNRELAASLAKMKRLMSDLPTLYAWAYNASSERVVRESVGKIHSGAVSTPTEQIVGDPLDRRRPGAQARIRAALESAPGQLANAENALVELERRIMAAMDGLDPHERPEPMRYPISVSQAELDDAKAAQKRRIDRGEGVA